MKLGIIKERKKTVDNRTPLTPKQCMTLMAKYPDLEIVVEPSDVRCYREDEYEESGVKVETDMSSCDVLLGVKEVPIADLIPDKTYFFFSHTIKEQPENQALLNALVEKNIRFIDYEALKFEDGQRVVGFGHWAGIVGGHNTLMAYGLKNKIYDLEPAYKFQDYDAMKNYYAKLDLPPMSIAATGSGRVAYGIQQLLQLAKVSMTSPDELDEQDREELFGVHFPIEDLYEDAEGNFDREQFFANPSAYRCVFRDYTDKFDILMNGIYWEKGIDPLFEADDIKDPSWAIQTIGDITCDKHGSVPINLGASTIEDPTYGVSRKTLEKVKPYESFEHSVDVMAVDNLPNELPRDSSEEFGNKMVAVIIPELLKGDSPIIASGTICENGALTPQFSYLQNYLSS